MSFKSKRLKIWERDDGICWICEFPVLFVDMTLDHYVPKSKGGTNALHNLRATHRLCNEKRGNGDPPLPKKHNKRKDHSKKTRLRGPVMVHITNDSAKHVKQEKQDKKEKKVLSTDERIMLQKMSET